MLDALKPLLDSDLVNEETRAEISEAWESKLEEARESVRAELREEFAQKYEHDKQTMVEAIDRMVTESLTAEMAEMKEEKAKLAEDRVNQVNKMKEAAEKFNNFMVTKLAEELKDLRQDRKVQTETVAKLEQFVVKALAEEIKEFAQDKQDVVETKVKLVAEAREKLEELKTKFVTESSEKMTNAVAKHLKAELSQLHEDIKVARENTFGRKIFEAFASEFGATHLNENAEIRKLVDAIAEKDQQIAEATEKLNETTQLVESKEKEIVVIKESNEREAKLDELLSNLNDEKAEVMTNLLEGVATKKLEAAFNKYLPAVLNENVVKSKKTTLTESVKEVTGDKDKQVKEVKKDEDGNIIDLRKLAGI
jgi:hypothetical protein